MLETQPMRLNRSRLMHASAEDFCLALEPLSLKAKQLRRLEPGAWIDLGERPPALQIRRDGRKIAEVHCRGGECLVGSLAPEEAEIPERKRVVLESRIAVLTREGVREGERLELPDPALGQILLFAEGRALATARLVRSESGRYALEIRERIDG
jgi:hypothetical protein